VVDIVRAARRLDGRLNNRWVIAGHSQGGHAALFAASEAPARAPELRFKGVTAFAPASHLLEQAKALPILRSPSPLSGLAALIVAGTAASTPTVSVPAIASDRARALFPQVGLVCLPQLAAGTSFGGIPPAELVRPGADLNPLYRVLGAQNPALRITAPVVVVQGDADGTVLKGFTDQLAPELRAKGDRLTYRVLPGVDHGSVVARDAAATLAWLRARLG